MNDQLKRLGLTQLARVLPTLLDEARQQQLSYDAFLRQALEAELDGRQHRALERRIRAAHLPRRVRDRKSTRLNSSHIQKSRMPSSA